ncbi:MAG: hypothetical protein RIS47_1437 [Bacteroidota bacterium]
MNENKSVFIKEYQLSSYHVNVHGNLTMPMLLNFIIEVAGEHASRNGFGFEAVMELQKTWVLSRMKVRMEKYPVYLDTIRVKTWVRTVEKYFSERNFEFSDAQGNVLGGAITSWAAIDLRTRRPTLVTDIPYGIELYPDRMALADGVEKLGEVSAAEYSEPVAVKFFDLDLNKHVTTVRYVEWVLDQYPFEFLSAHKMRTLEVQFMRETFIGERVVVGSEPIGLLRSHVILSENRDKEMTRLRFEWSGI